MNLDDLKNDWQQQEAPEKLSEAAAENLFQRYLKINKKMVRSNWFATISMLLSMLFIGWVWWTYEAKQGWAFDGSILSIEILISLILIVLWSRTIQEGKVSIKDDTRTFLRSAIKKLRRSINITRKVMPIYAVLLNISLVLYFYDLMASDMQMFWIATALTTAYIVIMMIVGYRRHRNKQRKEVEPLIQEMEDSLSGLTNE